MIGSRSNGMFERDIDSLDPESAVPSCSNQEVVSNGPTSGWGNGVGRALPAYRRDCPVADNSSDPPRAAYDCFRR